MDSPSNRFMKEFLALVAWLVAGNFLRDILVRDDACHEFLFETNVGSFFRLIVGKGPCLIKYTPKAEWLIYRTKRERTGKDECDEGVGCRGSCRAGGL